MEHFNLSCTVEPCVFLRTYSQILTPLWGKQHDNNTNKLCTDIRGQCYAMQRQILFSMTGEKLLLTSHDRMKHMWLNNNALKGVLEIKETE